MADPKGTYNNPGNTGLATAMTGTWQPAFMVSQNQHKEAELKKQQEAANQQKTAEGNEKFGEELFKDKHNSLDTQRNEYKNSILGSLRESYNEANLKYTARGQSIPLEERQALQKQVQDFKNDWEQVETAYNYTQGVIEQAEKDKTGVYNVDAFRNVLMDVPKNEDGSIDFSKYNERYVEDKIKENADVLYDVPKAAQLYAQTLTENILGSVKDMGDGRHEEIIEKANGMVQIFTDKNGRPTLFDENGESHINVSNESVALARKDKHLGPIMDAMVRKGTADNYADALMKAASGQAGVDRKVDRQGTIKTDKDGGGYSASKPKVETRFDTIHRALTNFDTDALAQMFDASGMVDVEFKGNEYGPGESTPDRIEVKYKEKYDASRHGYDVKMDGSGYVTLSETIDINSDRKKREAYFKINKFINSSKDRAATEVVSNDDIQMYMNEMDKKEKDVLNLGNQNNDPLGLGL